MQRDLPMQSDREIFDKTLVSDPGQWDLVLRPAHGSLGVALLPVARDVAPVWREISLEGPLPLQDAVYAHPLLLSDFRRVTVCIDARRFLFLPPEAADPAQAEALMSAAYPSDGSVTVMAGDLPVSMAMKADAEMLSFFRRTFVNLAVTHPLAVLIRYFAGRGARGGNGVHLYASFRGRRMDVAVLDGGRLLMGNTYDVAAAADGAYYVMAALKTLSLDPALTGVSFTGDQEWRAEATSMLRPYLGRLMPVIMPSGSRWSVSARLPFDLRIMHLCE